MKILDRLPWLETELRPLCGTTGTLPVYAVNVWCGDDPGREPEEGEDPGPFGWVEVATCHGARACVRVVRQCRRRGWSNVSLYVKRQD